MCMCVIYVTKVVEKKLEIDAQQYFCNKPQYKSNGASPTTSIMLIALVVCELVL